MNLPTYSVLTRAFLAATLGLSINILVGCATLPEPLSKHQLDDIATERISLVATEQEPINGPIDLYEAMARALKYNLDYKVEIMEQALRVEEVDLSNMDLLPKLVANAGYSDRNNDYGGRSVLIENPAISSLDPSTSIERQHTVADLTLSWNVLDFGLSYVRSKRLGNEVMIAMEQRRRVANRIIEDVRTAYWRAISSERLIKRLLKLDAVVDAALKDSSDLEKRKKSSPLDALTYQRELVSVRLQIMALHREFSAAKQQLAALMNVLPGTTFELVIPDQTRVRQRLNIKPKMLVEMALRNRSELREIDYKLRINSLEATSSLLEMLPGLNLYGGLNLNTNDLLHNEDWTAWGAKINWNLIKVFRYPHHKTKVEAQKELLHQQALATAMAIMTQVHISLKRFKIHNKDFHENIQYLDIQNRIDKNITLAKKSGRIGKQKWIRERMNTVVSIMKYDVAYANLQNIRANIYASVGYDALPEGIDGSESVADLSSALRVLWGKR